MSSQESLAARARRPWDALVERLLAMPEVLPGLLAVSVFVAWAAADGGYPVGAYAPGALFVLGLLAVVAIVFRPRLREVPRASAVAGAFLAAFVAWSFVSIAWAEVDAIAWEGANRTLLYATVFALFALLGWRAASAAIVVGAFSLGVAAVGLVSLLETRGAAEPLASFIDARWIHPTGYYNSSPALFLVAFWPALHLASRREVPWPARGLMLAAAGVLLQLALIPQSRGTMIAFPIVLAIYFAFVPGRVRSLLTIAPVGFALALSADPLLDVYADIGVGDDPAAVVDGAIRAIALGGLALLAVGAGFGALDARLRVPERATWLASRAVAAIVALAIVAAGGLFVREEGNPASWADERWQDFKSGQPERPEATRLGGSLGTNRYDFWRVAVLELGDAPLTGIGADNFAIPYLRERRSDEEPLHPHSLPIRLVSQTGIVGATLFLAFLAAALTGAARARWRDDAVPLAVGIAAAAVIAVAYWAAHGTGDWLWPFPALSAPAFAWLALAGRIEPASARVAKRTEGRSPAPRPLRWAGAGVAALLAGVAIASFTLPWAAARDVDTATTHWVRDPELAFDRLDRARSLNFLSARPDLIAGEVALRLGQERRATKAFERAVERDPHSWYAHLQLGAIAIREGRREAALGHLRAAAELSPDDPLIVLALRGARAGRSIPQTRIERDLIDRICARVGLASGLERCR